MTAHLSQNHKQTLYAACVMLIAALGSVALQGFDFATNNNVFHIPIIFDYANSAEGPSDFFHSSLGRYISGFWVAVSLFVSETNGFYVFLGLHVAIRFVTVFMIWKISGLLGGHSLIAAFLCSLILFFPAFLGYSPVGVNEILSNYLTHSQVVIPVVLGSWFFLLKRRFLFGAALAGLAFDINAFVGFWDGLVAGLAMLYLSRKQGGAYLLATAAKMFGIFMLVGAPVLVWLIDSTFSSTPFEAFSYRQYLREYYPHHNFIDTHFGPTLIMSLALVTGFFTLKHVRAGWSRDHQKLVSIIYYLLVIIFMSGMILPYVTDSRLLLNLYPLRMDTYLIYLTAIIVMSWCLRSLKASNPAETSYALVALFSLINGNFILLLVTVILAGNQQPMAKRHNIAPFILLLLMGVTHGLFGKPPVFEYLWGAESAVTLLLQGGVLAYFLPRNPTYMRYAYLLIAASIIGVLPEFQGAMWQGAILMIYAALIFCLSGKKEQWLLPLLVAFMAVVPAFLLASKIWLAVTAVVLLLPLFFLYIEPLIKKYRTMRLITETRFLLSGVLAYFLPRNPTYMRYAYLLIAASIIGVLPEFQGAMWQGAILMIYAALIFCLSGKKEQWLLPLLVAFMAVVPAFLLASKIWLAVTAVVLLLPLFFLYIEPLIKKYRTMRLITETRFLAGLYMVALLWGAGQMHLRGGLSTSPKDARNFTEVQLWARENTAPHTMFLPVGISGFSTLSRRPVWTDWKIGAMVMWSPETYRLWSTRWKQLKAVDTIADAQQLAQKENIEFTVFDKRKIPSKNAINSCIIYENNRYWIMKNSDGISRKYSYGREKTPLHTRCFCQLASVVSRRYHDGPCGLTGKLAQWSCGPQRHIAYGPRAGNS